jgi:hypothetical protein
MRAKLYLMVGGKLKVTGDSHPERTAYHVSRVRRAGFAGRRIRTDCELSDFLRLNSVENAGEG